MVLGESKKVGMRVLFVSSGNASKTGEAGVIVKAQGESLSDIGIDVEYFGIVGSGIKGYLKNVKKLRRFLKNKKYDVIHAHYSLSGFCASLAGAKPLVVSLMGSDVMASNSFSKLIEFCSKFIWKATIIKSVAMNKLKLSNVQVVPNGVNLGLFKFNEKLNYKVELDLDIEKKYILFVANPGRQEKNYQLALNAVSELNSDNVALIPVYNVPHSDIVKYMFAADVLVFTSLWEGSPNVIKEAMACNCPIVSVDVGDVKDVIEGVENCYLVDYDAKNIAEKLNRVLKNGKRSNGREKILKMGLDSESVANRIVEIYKDVLELK